MLSLSSTNNESMSDLLNILLEERVDISLTLITVVLGSFLATFSINLFEGLDIDSAPILLC